MPVQTLVICQAFNISKMLASLLVNSPKTCIVLQSLYSLTRGDEILVKNAISKFSNYLNNKKLYYKNLEKVYSIKTDLLNPVSVIKTLENIITRKEFKESEIIIDLSSGPSPTNIGLYLFASKYGIRNLMYSLAGERDREIESMNLSPEEKLEKSIEFTYNFSYNIPPMNLHIKDFPEEILFALAETPDNKIENMIDLNEKLGRQNNTKFKAQLSRECSVLESYGLITSFRPKKNKRVSLTPTGRQYVKYKKYNPQKLELIWQKPDDEDLELLL